jgi:lipase
MGGTSYNPWPLLGKITSPTLILEGENSENRHYIDLKKAASLMQNGSYRQIKEAGHLIPMEKPAETADILKEFFELI